VPVRVNDHLLEETPKPDAARTLRGLTEFHARATDALLAEDGLPGVVEVLASALGRPVALWGASGQVLAASEPAPVSRDDGWLCTPVSHGRDAVTIGVHDQHDLTADEPTRARLELLLEHAAKITALELYRIRSVASTELRVWGDLSSAILEPEDPDRVGLLAASLGYDLEAARRVIVTEPRLSDHDLSGLHQAVRSLDMHAMATRLDEHPVLIVDDALDWQALRRALEVQQPPVRMGASSSTTSVGGLAEPLREARLALRVSTTFGGPNITHFDELGVYQLFAHADPVDLEQHAVRWLGPLLEHDRTRKADLLRTLTEYLEGGGAVEATAQALFIHRSTLKYRLRRIEALLGRDLADAETRFNLQVATRALAAALPMQPGC
jgi:hypothetical protein